MRVISELLFCLTGFRFQGVYMKTNYILIATVFLLSACGSDIPNLEIKLNAQQSKKLKQLKNVTIERSGIFDLKCSIYNRPGARGYILTSSATKMSDDYARWSCGGNKLAYLNCPYMTIDEKDGKGIVSVHEGDKEDYSKRDVNLCAMALIDNAPVEMRPTSEKVRNDETWSEDS